MLPEPPQPQKPQSQRRARRLSDKSSAKSSDKASDTQPGAARLLADAVSDTPRPVAAQALSPRTQRGLGADAGARFAGLPVYWAAVALAGGAAAVACGTALLLTQGLGLSAAAGAVGAALTGLAAAALPAVALARRCVPASGHLMMEPADPRRGVASKPQFLDLIEREWSRARRYGTGAALLLIDVDRHARLADTHGAPAPDAVLAELARHTAPTLRGADAIAHFGPSQLAVFLAHADPTGALDVAERIRERAEALQIGSDAAPLRLTVSLGVAPLRAAHLHMQALVHDAEDAVFAARQAGGNCVRSAPLDSTARPSGSWRSDHRTKP